MKKILYLLFTLILFPISLLAQDINLYKQFNGRYDFTFVGNTLNPSENNITPTCTIYTSSSASLNLLPNDTILHAYLYWAGSGTGDLDIKLNGVEITATRTFPLQAINTDGNIRDYFGAWADVTQQVISTGNGNYTVSDLDLTEVVSQNLYCGIKTNFGGWAIIVVYENPALPLNQLNLYDGMGYVPPSIKISLPSLNVIDNEGAKIGFLAWEGDAGLAVEETLKLNGNKLSNALNPPDNAFNGTNTVTGSNKLYNMDLDIYEIQDYIKIGDATAEIELTSGQDFVMVNAIVTKLNSQLPDATVTVNEIVKNCGSRSIEVNYTVYNYNSTDTLPAGTQVGVYVNDDLITTFATTADLPIGGSQNGTITITIPESYPDNFELRLTADYNGAVIETDETNNSFTLPVELGQPPVLRQPDDITACDTGLGLAVFDFSEYAESLKNTPNETVTFYTSQQLAEQGTDNIYNTSTYKTEQNPERIYVRIDNGTCFTIGSFLLLPKKCKPVTYNYITPNGDNVNDTFFIEGLRNIFLNFTLKIYNRWGNLVWTGDHNKEDWNGIATEQKVGQEGTTVPNSTYYFVLELNDPDYPEPIVGWIYVTM